MSVLGVGLRDIAFSVTSTDVLTYEAVEAAVGKVREIESALVKNPDLDVDLADKKVVLTGKTPYKIFVFTARIVKATGTYTFVLDEIAPNVETATTL